MLTAPTLTESAVRPLTLGRWVRATWYGWLLGIPLIVILALLGEAIGIGGSQVIVGLGMGLGVGLLQARAIRGLLPRPAAWGASCFLGLGLPFLLTDLAPTIQLDLPYSLPLAVAAGGLIIGVWQALLLRGRVRSAGWWAVASLCGWTLAAGMAYLGDSVVRDHAVRGIIGALLYLGAVAGGGLLLGVVTGPVLVRLAPTPPVP